MYRYLPNLISASRIVAVPVLGWLAWNLHAEAFTWLLFAAIASDVLDGAIARGFGLATPLGARLDSIADVLLMLVTVYGVWVFHYDFVIAEAAWLALLGGLWVTEVTVSLLRYGRLSSFHTWAVRAGAASISVFVLVLFAWGFVPWLFALAVALCVLAQLEELVLLAMLPRWTPDVRGVWWVLHLRRKSSTQV